MIWDEWNVGQNNESSAATLSANRWMEVMVSHSHAAIIESWSAAASPASSALKEVACSVANDQEWRVVPL